MDTKLTKLEISRREWLRGNFDDSVLFDSTIGQYCCIGLLARELGAPDDVLDGVGCLMQFEVVANKGYKNQLSNQQLREYISLDIGQESIFLKIYQTNDDDDIDDDEREERLTNLFHDRLGIELTFVD